MTRPVVTAVSQATRASGSLARIASRTPSEIWSASLSGWPSVTDSDVNRRPAPTSAAAISASLIAQAGSTPLRRAPPPSLGFSPLGGVKLSVPHQDEARGTNWVPPPADAQKVVGD